MYLPFPGAGTTATRAETNTRDLPEISLRRFGCGRIGVKNDRLHSRNDGFYTRNDGFYTKNDGILTRNDGFYTAPGEFNTKMMNVAQQKGVACAVTKCQNGISEIASTSMPQTSVARE